MVLNTDRCSLGWEHSLVIQESHKTHGVSGHAAMSMRLTCETPKLETLPHRAGSQNRPFYQGN